MANYFSYHYAAVAASESIDDPRIKAAPGISHSAVRYKRATVLPAAAVTDDEQCRIFPMKSSDRIHQLWFSTISLTGTTMTADLGIYESEKDGNALLDLDLFCPAATVPLDDLTDAVARTDMTILGILTDQDRGTQLWEMFVVGAGTITEDPNETWDIVMTMNTETAVTAAAELVFEVFYTSGGN